MGRLAADDAAERDDRDVPARLRERHRADRQLERARHRHDRDVLPFDPGAVELRERRLEQPVRDLAVEARDDDRDPLPRSLRRALDELDAYGNDERAGRVTGWLLRDGLRLGLGLLDDNGFLHDENLLAGVLALVDLDVGNLARPVLVVLLGHSPSSKRSP